MELVRDLGAAFAVLLPAARGEVEDFAAGELVRYIEQMTGAKPGVSGEPVEGLIPLYLGTRDQLLGMGVDDLPQAKPGYDGYSLEVMPHRLLIMGENPRGVLYAVYDLLEHCGCRWYTPALDPEDPEIIPHHDVLELHPFRSSEAGGFKTRAIHPGSMIYKLRLPDALAQVDWLAKARYNEILVLISGNAGGTPAQAMEAGAPLPSTAAGDTGFYEAFWEYQTSGMVDAMRQRGIRFAAPAHCMVHLMPNSLFDEHPDWFGMVEGGQREPQRPLGPEFCWSSRGAVDCFATNVVDWLRAMPILDVFAFTPNDGGAACRCPDCIKHNPSDLYAELANTVLRKLREAGLPVEVEITGGYPPVADPPSEGVLDPAVRVHWAHWGRHHGDWYGGESYGMRANLDAWIASGHEFTMVSYYTDSFASPPIHPPVAAAMRQDNRWLLEQGVAGHMVLTHPHEQWWSQALDTWLGISFYYSERDPVAFLHDYATHYFGAAGEPMARFHRILTDDLAVTYTASGGRWSEPGWVNLDEEERVARQLDHLASLMSQARELAVTPTDRHRLGRLSRQFDLMVVMARARRQNMELVLRVAAVERGDREAGPVADDLRLAIRHEREVVDPMVQALVDRQDGTLSEEMAGIKLIGHAAKAMEEKLVVLVGSSAAATIAP